MDAVVAEMSSLAGIDLAALDAACEKYGVAELAVFGSVVTGEARPDSDIDGSPGMNVGRDLLIGLKAHVLQGFRGSGGLLGDAHVW